MCMYRWIAVCLLFFSLTACAPAPTEVSYAFREIQMALTLPDGWAYEIVPVPETAACWEELQDSMYGIAFWPEEAPETEMGLYFRTDGLGLCGFGVHTDNIPLTNGGTANAYWYTDTEEESWYVYFEGAPENYVLSGYVPAAYREEFLQIVRSVTVAADTLSASEAVELAAPYTTKPYTHTNETYNGWDGSWTIRFAPKAYLTDPEVFCVAADGTVTAVDG